jgi:hypothetical protein
MSETSRYSSMSNEEFLKILKSKEADKSWTLGEVIEYQRRGAHAFDHDLKLIRSLDRFIAEQNTKYGEILKPIQDSMSKIVSLSISDSTTKLLKNLASQNSYIDSLLPIFELPPLSFPKFELKDVVKIDPTIVDRPLTSPHSQKVIVEGFHEATKSHSGHLAQIAENTRWDWKQWTLFGLAAVAAVTGILSLIR